MKKLLSLAILVLATLASKPAHAATLYSDFGTGSSVYDPYIPFGGFSISGSGFGSHGSQEIAVSFTVSGTGLFAVTQIDLAVGYQFGNGNFIAK